MGWKVTLLATAVATLLAAAAAQAQDVVQKDLGEGVNPESAVCSYNFTASNIKWCLNANGNLVSLRSPGEIEHIRYNTGFGPTAAEGYILCLYGALKAYDNAKVGAGFGPPTVIAGPTATGITIRRKTLDGTFQLDQKWSRDNAERDLTLEMTLKNLGPPVNGVELGRVTDVNVDYSLDGLFLDRFDRTRYTLWFRDQVNGRDGVTMKLLTLNPAYYVVVAKYEPAPECTYPQLAFPGGPQDVMGHARMIFGSMSSGAQKVVKIGYRVE